MDSLLEGILDTDKNIADKLDQEIIELKSKIRTWVIDYVYVSTKDYEHRRANPRDFEVDDSLCISVNKHVEGVTIYSCLDIPTYIRFKYTGKDFKIRNSNVKSGDASFLFQHFSKQGLAELEYIVIDSNQFKSIGDFSKLKLWMFQIEDNKNLKMKVSELPKIDVSFKYTGNGNEFKLSDIKSKLKYPDATVVKLDHATQNVRESIVDSDIEIQDKIKNQSYYVAEYARILVKTLSKYLDFKKCKLGKDDYVFIPLKNEYEKKIITTLKTESCNNTVSRIMQVITQELVDIIFEACKKEDLTEKFIKTHTLTILEVSNWWFGTFKIGDPKYMNDDPDKRIYPAMGLIISDKTDFTNSRVGFLIDLDDYQKDLIQQILRYSK